MKKYILLLAFITIITQSKAQITQEHNYAASATLTELLLSGYKYYLMDISNNQCRIYNTDHTLWKTINLSVPSGQYLYDIRYVSESLFNTDNKVDLAYTYYVYDTTLFYYTYTTRVIDEDGMELLTIPGCSFVNVKSAGSNGAKLLAYVYDYSLLPYTLNTLVYSLPGTLTRNGIDSQGDGLLQNAYPNPSRNFVTIPYKLFAGHSRAQIQLINETGQVLKSYQVDHSLKELIIPTTDLPKGILIYQLKTDQGLIESGKLIHD